MNTYHDALRINNLEEHKPYHFVSPISGEAGEGRVWFKIIQEKKEFSYEDTDGKISVCQPCSLTRFIPIK